MRSHTFNKRYHPRKQKSIHKYNPIVNKTDTENIDNLSGSGLKPVQTLITELSRITLNKPKKVSKRKYIF